MSTALIQNILTCFECPVCYVYVSPPIKQCIYGHILCPDCYDRVDRCPVCRSQKSVPTSSVMEAMYELLKFPCRYTVDGCDVISNGSIMKEHEKICQFAPWICFYRSASGCIWKGARHQFLEHLNDQHPCNFYKATEKRIVFHVMPCRNAQNTPYMHIFYAYGVFFRANWDLDPLTLYLKVSVNILDCDVNEELYSYEVILHDKGTQREVASLRSICRFQKEGGLNFDRSLYVSVPKRLLLKYRDNIGDVHFTIRMLKTDLDEEEEEVDLSEFVSTNSLLRQAPSILEEDLAQDLVRLRIDRENLPDN